MIRWQGRQPGSIGIAVMIAVLTLVALAPAGANASSGVWLRTNSPAIARAGATATLLVGPACKATSPPAWCGEVLLAGGSAGNGGNTFLPATAAAELYNPRDGTWSPTGSLNAARGNHTATLLANGKVLVTGGDGAETSAELYDPGTGAWTSCPNAAPAPTRDCPGPMGFARTEHTATLLKDGRVLVAGSPYIQGHPVAQQNQPTEIYDPATGSWSTTGSLNESRYQQTATLLPDGRVLVAGGLFSPPLPGQNEWKSSTELYDPSTGAWASCPTPVPTPNPDCPGPLSPGRYEHTATRLANGKVVVAGGTTNSAALQSTEYYDPATGTWYGTGPLQQVRAGHAAVLLPDGQVLVAGGNNFGEGINALGQGPAERALSSAELYDPTTGQWGSAGSMNDARASYFDQPHSVQAVLLSSKADGFGADPALCGSRCGKVLVVGGQPGFRKGPVASAELYTPVPAVIGLSPASGPAAGGTEVTVAGRGFTHNVVAVRFGDAPAQSFTVDSYSQLRAVSPPAAAGASVGVTVVNEGGSATSTQTFSYTANAGSVGSAGGTVGSAGGTVGSAGGTVGSAGGTVGSAGGTVGSAGGTVGSAGGGGIVGGVQSAAAARALASALAVQARRQSALRSCLAAVAGHVSREGRLARRGSARRRALLRRRLSRAAASRRRRCLGLYARTPGRVTNLTAGALSPTQIQLGFNAPGSDANHPPAAQSYLVKQSTRPIRSARDFARAQTLCRGACRFNVSQLGAKIDLTVTELRPHTTYYYAIAARDNVSARPGPRTRAVRARTR